MELNVQNRFDTAQTVVATGFAAQAIDMVQTSYPAEGETLDPIGAFVSLGTIATGAGVTYQLQVINDIDTSGTNTPIVVADTGTLTCTASLPARLSTPSMFLAIDWGLVSQRYMLLKFTLAGGGASFGHNGAWLTQKTMVPANTNVINNYPV